MRLLFLCSLFCFCALAAEKPKLVEYKPTLPPVISQKAPSDAKVPPLPRLMVPREAKNWAYRKPVTADYRSLNGSLQQINDGQKDVWMTLNKGLHWVQIDLSAPCQIYAIHLWHSFTAPYIYRDVVVQISDDKTFRKGVVTVFNNSRDKKSRFGLGANKPYVESRNGLLLDTNGPDKLGVIGRYVRLWSNGSQIDNFNRYLEVDVIATSDFEPVKFVLPPGKYL